MRKIRPLRAGTSISHRWGHRGTLGCFCWSAGSNDAGVYLLSNAHVITRRGFASPGDSVCQPAAADGGSDGDVVARLADFVPLYPDREKTNVADAAVAKLEPGIQFDPEIPGIGFLSGVGRADVGMVVCKVGASSGLTVGTITDVAVSMDAYLDRRRPGRAWAFEGVIRIEPTAGHSSFGIAGDSGALVVEQGTRKAVGLFFSGSEDGSSAYACPLSHILEALEIQLLIGDKP